MFLARREGPAGFRKDLVIKRILPHLARNQGFIEMFLREARLAALIDHPNLVHVSAFGEIDGEYYLAMEFVDGFTLTEVARRMPLFTPGVACRITVDLLEALNAVHGARSPDGAHLGLVHRDVGPGNVMLTRDGAVKLLDFGIAVSKGDDTSTRMGTRRFMSPEQLDGREQDARSDLFSVGVLLFALLTGRAPYETYPLEVPERPPEVPEALWPTIASALEPDPDRRPASTRAMLAALELFLASCGAEGTRSHLAEVLQSRLPPSGSAADRAVSRLTQQLTHLTRVLTGTQAAPPDEAEVRDTVLRPAARPEGISPAAVAGAVMLLFVLGAAGAWWLRAAPIEVEPLPAALVPAQAPAPAEAVASQPSPARAEAVPEPAVAPDPSPAHAEEAAPRPAPAKAARTATRRPKDTRPGRLTIDTRPWTEVFLGARRLGMTPLQGVELPAGKHRLRLKNAEVGLDTSVTVQIRAGQETRLRRTL